MASRPPGAVTICPTFARKRQLAAASTERNDTFYHMSCSTSGASTQSSEVFANASPSARARGVSLLSPSNASPILGSCWECSVLLFSQVCDGTIIGTVLQTIVDVVDFELNIGEATHIPRVHPLRGGTIELEPNFNPDTSRLLGAMGHKVKVSQTMGSTQSIVIEAGKFLGAADPRRPGALAVGVDSLQ